MQPVFHAAVFGQVAGPDMFDVIALWLHAGVYALLWVALVLGPVCAISYLGYFLLSLPMRRAERARIFLDVAEMAVRDGRNLEQTIVSVSQSRDMSVGVRFHLLAAWLENGLRLMVPPFITAGERVVVDTNEVAYVRRAE